MGMKQKLSSVWLVVMAVFLLAMGGCGTLNVATPVSTPTVNAACPDTGITAVTLNVQNPLNTTGAETFDQELTFLGAGGKKATGTDSTDGAYNLDCGTQYELILESADGASGDNSRIVEVLEGNGAQLTSKGTVIFTPTGYSYNLRVAEPQHGTLEFKLYDNEDARFAYDTGDASNSDWEVDPVTWRDGDNATAFALSQDGDSLNMRLDLRTNEVDTEFSDNYMLIAIEAPVTEYDEPTVKYNGKTLKDIKGSGLNSYESKALSGYEYVYKVEGADVTHSVNSVDFYMEANSDASTDVQLDFYAAGKVDSINGVDILTSAAQDNSGATVVYTVQDVTIDVS